MRFVISVSILTIGCASAFAQQTGASKPPVRPQTQKVEKKEADQKKTEVKKSEGGFACTASSVRVKNLRQMEKTVALPPLYAQPFIGTCEQAEKRAKAIPSQDTNYLILGRMTPIEMARGLCQSGAGNRNVSRGDLKPSRAGLTRLDNGQIITITKNNAYGLMGTGSGFDYTLSGTCKPTTAPST